MTFYVIYLQQIAIQLTLTKFLCIFIHPFLHKTRKGNSVVDHIPSQCLVPSAETGKEPANQNANSTIRPINCPLERILNGIKTFWSTSLCITGKYSMHFAWMEEVVEIEQLQCPEFSFCDLLKLLFSGHALRQSLAPVSVGTTWILLFMLSQRQRPYSLPCESFSACTGVWSHITQKQSKNISKASLKSSSRLYTS